MAIELYGRDFDHGVNERIPFNELLLALVEQWGDERLVLITNASWDAAPLDLVCIKRNAILVIDLKSAGGTLTGGENGSWTARKGPHDTFRVKAGTFDNPFKQIDFYRSRVSKFLSDIASYGAIVSRNQILGCAMFTRPVDDQLTISDRARRFFRLTDIANAPRYIYEAACADLALTDSHIALIIERLGVERLTIPGVPLDAPALGAPDNGEHPPAFLAGPLLAIKTFLDGFDRLQIIRGGLGTGRDTLAIETTRFCARVGKSSSLFSVNGASALRIGNYATSLFGHDGIFTTKVRKTKGRSVRDVRTNTTPKDVYIVADAHHVTDSEWLNDDMQFGTGNLIDDILEYIGSIAKLIVIGDPFMFCYGHSLIDLAKAQTLRLGIPQVVDLTKHEPQFGQGRFDAFADLIASEIQKKGSRESIVARFKTTDGIEPHNIETLNDLDLAKFANHTEDTIFVAQSHEEVSPMVREIRARAFGRGEDLVAGDYVYVVSDPIEMNYSRSTSDLAGRTFEVLASRSVLPPDGRQFSQNRKGSDEPISIEFIEVDLITNVGTETRICNDSYLKANRPDERFYDRVALMIWAKNVARQRPDAAEHQPETGVMIECSDIDSAEADDDRNDQLSSKQPLAPEYARFAFPTKIRYAYGMPLRRAENIRWQHVVALLSPKHTDDQFSRYVYSLCTIATETLSLYRVPRTGPFASVSWSGHKDADCIDTEFDCLTALRGAHIDEPDSVRAKLRADLDAALDLVGFRRVSTTNHLWQEQYLIVDGSESRALLIVAYFNGKGVFTKMWADRATDRSIIAEFRSQLGI